MQLLEQRILAEGEVKSSEILKVDRFLNHQMDPKLFLAMAEEWKRLFDGCGVNKLVTIEASGIGIAAVAGLVFDCPVVFAKKTKSRNVSDDAYTTVVHSFTHGNDNTIRISREYLSPDDRVLVIDDFLANGAALDGLITLIEGAGATSANTVIKIEPSSITLAGDTSILAGMNKIVLGTIDLTDFTDAFQNTYSIVLDNEVRNLTGITEAKVTVEIIGLETRDFTVTNLSCINDTEGYKSTIITESLTVTLRGTKEQLDAIQSENIRAVADLKDFKESSGTYMVPVKVYVAGYDDVGAIGDVTMSVEIRKA